MATPMQYRKPNMAAMPVEIGRRVITEIMNSKPVNQQEIHERNEALRRELRAEKETRQYEERRNGK